MKHQNRFRTTNSSAPTSAKGCSPTGNDASKPLLPHKGLVVQGIGPKTLDEIYAEDIQPYRADLTAKSLGFRVSDIDGQVVILEGVDPDLRKPVSIVWCPLSHNVLASTVLSLTLRCVRR